VIAAGSPLLGSIPDRRGNVNRYQQTLSAEGVDAFLALLRSAPRHPERHPYWRAAAHCAGPDALIAQYEALTRLGPLTERLRLLRPPALFLTGDRDFVRTHIEQSAAATEQARLALVPDAGHAVFGDNPGDYFSALESILD
jgi:pimeloyl-ACP methyl ester carboxylesterase